LVQILLLLLLQAADRLHAKMDTGLAAVATCWALSTVRCPPAGADSLTHSPYSPMVPSLTRWQSGASSCSTAQRAQHSKIGWELSMG
jgi:hypothetical protein